MWGTFPPGTRAERSYHSRVSLHLPQTSPPTLCAKGKKVPLDDTTGVRAALRPVLPVLHFVLEVQRVQEASCLWQDALMAGSSAPQAHAHQLAELRDGCITWEKHWEAHRRGCSGVTSNSALQSQLVGIKFPVFQMLI